MYLKQIRFIALLMVVSLAIAVFVQAVATSVPEGTSALENKASTRRLPASASSMNAEAGNVTQLNITGTTVTQLWQGFYGNISGTITLDDSTNNTLYNWALTSPEGEIYAIRGGNTPNWSSGNIFCMNFSETGTSNNNYFTVEELQALMNATSSDLDSVNATFQAGGAWTDVIYVGQTKINGSAPTQSCKHIHTYVSDAAQTTSFTELLLYDTGGTADPSDANSGFEIYTAILEETDPVGFDGAEWDFQMMVTDDGHLGDTATTQYYFYVELE